MIYNKLDNSMVLKAWEVHACVLGLELLVTQCAHGISGYGSSQNGPTLEQLVEELHKFSKLRQQLIEVRDA